MSAAPIVVDLHPDPSAPAAAAYPSTLPAAAALFGTPEASRYAHFLEQLQVGWLLKYVCACTNRAGIRQPFNRCAFVGLEGGVQPLLGWKVG